MNKEFQLRLDNLVKEDPYIGIQDAAKTLGVSLDAIRKHIKKEQGAQAGWESYTGINRQQRSARNRTLQAAKDAENDDIEQMIVKAAQEAGVTKLGAIASHLGLTKNELAYRMQRRGTSLAKIMQEHANIGVNSENLLETIKREILANPELTQKEFAESMGVNVSRVSRALKKKHCTTWQGVKKRTLKDLPTRANKALKALILVADNPEAKTIYQAAKLIGENPQYIRRLLDRRKISWGENFIEQAKPVKLGRPLKQARIAIPERLLIPLRSYKHSTLVYNNTDARI